MKKIRITEPTLARFSGQMFGVQFTNGVSAEPLDDKKVMAIGAAMRITAVDSDTQITPTSARNEFSKTQARELVKEKPVVAAKSETVSDAKIRTEKVYTREQLEAIADKDGIKALRELGKEFGVKGRAIEELISEILIAQGIE